MVIETLLATLIPVIGVVVALVAWYTIPPPMEAHLVVTPKGKFVASPDAKVGTKRWYFNIPKWIPFFGRQVRVMDMTIQEVVRTQETNEEGQARYNVTSSSKFRVGDVKNASEKFFSFQELVPQLVEIIEASVREVTIQHDFVTARAKKKAIGEAIKKSMSADFADYGLTLVNFQLVNFTDTEDSKIVSDISLRREKEIQATTRQQNAEKEKVAKIKEAEADEKARQREIERDQRIGEQEQLKDQKISEMKKVAKEKEYLVIQVETIKQAEINKEKAIVEAKQAKEQEEILKQKKKLEGEGDRLKQEEQAKGLAAPIREKGFAEAAAKEKLQLALNKFGDDAIRALVAEKIVEMQEAVGVAGAKALEKSDMKVFAGGDGAKPGFDLGAIIGAVGVSNESAMAAVLNKMSKPNDLGINFDMSKKTQTDKKPKKTVDANAAEQIEKGVNTLKKKFPKRK